METLKTLMEAGIVYIDGADYVGIAADGVHVSLGCDEASVIRYLETHPSPDTW